MRDNTPPQKSLQFATTNCSTLCNIRSDSFQRNPCALVCELHYFLSQVNPHRTVVLQPVLTKNHIITLEWQDARRCTPCSAVEERAASGSCCLLLPFGGLLGCRSVGCCGLLAAAGCCCRRQEQPAPQPPNTVIIPISLGRGSVLTCHRGHPNPALKSALGGFHVSCSL